jgi:hypothetical protein
MFDETAFLAQIALDLKWLPVLNCPKTSPLICFIERFPSRYKASTKNFPCWAGASHAQLPYIQVKTAIGGFSPDNAMGRTSVSREIALPAIAP